METFLKGCAQPRAKEFFGFDWQFALTDSLDTPDDSASWREVQLPHDWSVDYPVEEDAPSCGSGGYARTGIGCTAGPSRWNALRRIASPCTLKGST